MKQPDDALKRAERSLVGYALLQPQGAMAIELEPHHFADGRWGAATLEVCLAMLESAKQRKEIMLSHQVPSPE